MCVRVCACVRACVCVSVRSFLPPRASRSRNIGTYVFVATRKKTFMIVIFAKNATFRSYICLPPMPPTTLKPKTTQNDLYQRNQLKVGKPLIVEILTKNTSFRNYGTFAFLLRAHIYPQYKYAYVHNQCTWT